MGAQPPRPLPSAEPAWRCLTGPQSKGKEVADAIGGAFHELDVTDFAGTEQVLQQAVDGLGGLHIAVTTAGGWNR